MDGILLVCSGSSGFMGKGEVENADYFGVECWYVGGREVRLGKEAGQGFLMFFFFFSL